MEVVEEDLVEQSPSPEESWWSGLPAINPWVVFLLAVVSYYVYQKCLSNLQFPPREAVVTPQDEEKVRKMMEARSRQQEVYDQAAKDMEEKKKSEPPAELGPISRQIAAKAKLRPEYNPLMGDASSSGPPRHFARKCTTSGG